MAEELLRVENLKKYFVTNSGLLHAVDDVSFSLGKGKTLGVVGESGVYVGSETYWEFFGEA